MSGDSDPQGAFIRKHIELLFWQADRTSMKVLNTKTTRNLQVSTFKIRQVQLAQIKDAREP
jgi:hypothetical protein